MSVNLTIMTVPNGSDGGQHRDPSSEGIGARTQMNKLMKNLDAWIAEQEVPVVIALIVLILVSWGIYPLIAR